MILIWSLLLAISASAEVGVTDSEILIGSSGSFTGPNVAGSKALRDGAARVYEMVNAKGGIHGRKIRFLSLDDGYDPQKAKHNGEDLVKKHGIFAYVHGNGGAGIGAMLPLLESENVPLLFPFAPNDFMYAKKKNVFALPIPSQSIVDLGFKYLIKEYKPKKVGSVYLDDPSGRVLIEAAKRALAANQLSFARSSSVGRMETQMDRPVRELKESAVDVVFVAINSNPTEIFVKTALKEKFNPKFLITYATPITHLLKLEGDIFAITSEAIPLPSEYNSKVTKDFRKEVPDLDPTLEGRAFYGYLGARIFVEALRQAGRDLTRKKLISTLESMNGFDLDGIKLALSASNHVALSEAYIYKLENKKVEFIDFK